MAFMDFEKAYDRLIIGTLNVLFTYGASGKLPNAVKSVMIEVWQVCEWKPKLFFISIGER